MADVDLTIGGRRYTIACRDGGEAHLRSIAAMVDRKAAEARSAVGDVNEVRQLLFAALLLADELSERAGQAVPSPANDVAPKALMQLADRIEAVAKALEQRAAAS